MAFTNSNGGKYKSSTESDVLNGTFYIDFIEWYSKAASAGEDLLISDGDGNEIQIGVADGSNFHQIYPVGQYYTNPTITTLDSGTVYIKTRKHHTNP